MTTGNTATVRRNWFDRGGDTYARFRPTYPDALAAFLANAAPGIALAVDVGCGSGQFTRTLGDRFNAVVGIDPSADQIAHAAPHPRVRYVVGAAERLAVADASTSLIVAAQAAHWFDRPRFYAEARRVAVPGAAIALVSYGAARLEPAVDPVFRRFYAEGIGAFWPPERALVDAGYAGIDFPFREVVAPAIEIAREWSADDLLGYVSTWSAVARAREAGRDDLLVAFAQDLSAVWGDPAVRRRITWPVAMRLGVID